MSSLGTNTTTNATRRLTLAFVLSIVTLIALTVFYAQGAHTYSRLARELFLWPAILILGGAYLWTAWPVLKFSTQDLPAKWVWAGGIALSLIALLIEPFHSTDLLGYINRGWQQVAHGTNPYVTTIGEINVWQNDAMFTDHWVNNPCPYGFAFAGLAKWLCTLGQSHLWFTGLLFKLINLLAHLSIAFIVWRGSKHLQLPRPNQTLFLYLWSPLIFLHHIANGHNDLLMGVWVILAAYMGLKHRWWWMLPLLTMGILVKYAAIVVFPLAMLLVFKHQRWKGLALGLLASALLVIIFGAPYLSDWQQFQFSTIGGNASLSHNSLHAFVSDIFKNLLKLMPLGNGALPVIQTTFKALLFAGLGAVFFNTCKWTWTQPQDWLKHWCLLFFVALCIVSSKFYGWYFGMFWPLALWLPVNDRLRQAIIATIVLHLLGLTFIGQAHIINYLLMLGLPTLWWLWPKVKKFKAT